ncbi:autophagy- protein [Zygosaccharomyces mellis]|uniref:Autophagy-related protein 29 n=1 Tax=Zygosaccharomyces mellis TaxID=42258 RepID=A0A4C2E8N0_9SACH|nr:autophagy- protein [Zygosaccharomyces mellis]
MNNQNTVIYVKLKGKRPDGFTNPSKFEWNLDKERQLWTIVSKLENYQDQINWQELSQTLDVPDYFLKKRSYKLFAKRLKILEQQIERKIKIDDDSVSQEKPTRVDPSLNPDSGNITADDRRSSGTNDNTNILEKTTMRTLQQLHTSKILSRARLISNSGRDTQNSSQNQSNSDSESSSSLSVSNSALEEALMDRLKL